MTIQEIIDEIKARAIDAEQAMDEAEFDFGTEYDYHQGRFEAYGAMAGWLEAQFFASAPISK